MRLNIVHVYYAAKSGIWLRFPQSVFSLAMACQSIKQHEVRSTLAANLRHGIAKTSRKIANGAGRAHI
jgi:hypothetical protein